MDLQSPITRTAQSKARVKVAIRVRPMLPRELLAECRPCIEVQSESDILICPSQSDRIPQKYTFDRVFPEQAPQQDVYQHCIRDLVLSCFDGYNAAVLAYGQTGSGKTFTMGTAISALSEDSKVGIIPRVIQQIFDQVEKRSGNATITVNASYIELYNEQINDLLLDGQFKKNDNIAIKEDRETGLVTVEGVTREVVTTPLQMLRLLERGAFHRTTKHTNMNDVSSRSHAIFTVFIDSQPVAKEDKKEDALTGITHSRFFFADLAGSERAKKTGATGDTLKQGININLGLLELGNVISALSTIDKNKDQFITFRNSKLTRILQDALGGNSNTYMIACVSPADFNHEQSLNTLKYARKAMNIKNTPVINRNKQDQLKQENTELKSENRRLKLLLAEQGVKIEDDEPHDQMAVESQHLRQENRALNRRYNECLVDLQATKHKLNELEIKMYDIRREKDIMQINFEELLRENPQISENSLALGLRERFEQNDREKISVLERNLQQIQLLETKLVDRDNLYSQLQAQYNSLLANSKKDELMLINKHKLLHAIARQNQKLKQEIGRISQINNESKDQIIVAEQANFQDTTIAEQVQAIMIDSLEQDELIQSEQEDYVRREQQTKDQLNTVDKYIQEKEVFLEKISREQLTLENELINSMKNEYHQKIALLERERKQLVKQRDQSGTVEKSKFINKIENLQNELKDYRKKAKEQNNMEKKVENQLSKIRDLKEELKKYQLQKGELHRKLKEDRNNFDRLKNQRIKELLQARKENLKKQNDLRKEKIINFKHEQNAKKKDEQIKRIKRVNEALKIIAKPPSHAVRKRQSMAISAEATSQDLKHFDKTQEELASRIVKQVRFQLQREHSIAIMQSELTEAEQQLTILLNQVSVYKIKKERIDLKASEDELTQEQKQQQQELKLIIGDLEERMQACQVTITQRQKSDLLRQTQDNFDLESAILYNKTYDNLDALRSFVRALFNALRITLQENCNLSSQMKTHQRDLQIVKERLKQERENLLNLNAQYHRTLIQMREESLVRYYGEEPETTSTLKRLDQRERKQMEKKVQDLGKSNRQLTAQLQKMRRKCEIVQEKYQSIKNLVSKDKNIGRPEEASFLKPDKKSQKQTSNRQLLEELDGMIESIDRLKKVRSFSALDQPHQLNQSIEQPSQNRWETVWKIDAHNSGVLSLAVHSNFMISTATKSIRLWDLQSRKMIAQLQAPAAVKYVLIDPDRRLFFTACEKQVTIWDLISLQVQGVLKSHKDETRVVHSAGDYLFTGGKGSPNGGSLLIWDLRKLNPNQALQEKEKSQDIFTFASKDNILYYGTRNHSVRRMNIPSWDVLAPFQPPHLDSVTTLAIAGDKLVSGSKDKHLRLWGLDHAVNNSKHTFHAFNDYVTTLQSPQNHQIFYAGCKDGQTKACHVKADRIEVLSTIPAHSQSVNSMCTLDDNPFALLTASQDKTVKLWQPTNYTLENISRENAGE